MSKETDIMAIRNMAIKNGFSTKKGIVVDLTLKDSENEYDISFLNNGLELRLSTKDTMPKSIEEMMESLGWELKNIKNFVLNIYHWKKKGLK